MGPKRSAIREDGSVRVTWTGGGGRSVVRLGRGDDTQASSAWPIHALGSTTFCGRLL
jgi:hypothetical protein